MSPISLGIDFSELEQLAKPPLVPDGTYEGTVEEIKETNWASGRPAWFVRIRILNRPDIKNPLVSQSVGLPWQDPAQGGQWDYSNTFSLVNLINGVHMQVAGKNIPDKESFYGKSGIIKVGHKPRKDDPEQIDQTVNWVVPRKGGGVVA
jgi:hypothetical protein